MENQYSTIQYNVPVSVINEEARHFVQSALQPYRVFTTERGHLDRTAFGKDHIPYIGDVAIIKTLKRDAAVKAYEVLSLIDGLQVHPIFTCSWEDDCAKVSGLRDARRKNNVDATLINRP